MFCAEENVEEEEGGGGSKSPPYPAVWHHAIQPHPQCTAEQPAPDELSRRKEAIKKIIQNYGHPWIPEGPRLTTMNIAMGFPAASGNPDPEGRLCPNLLWAPGMSLPAATVPEPKAQACVPGRALRPLWQTGNHLQTQWFWTKAVAGTTKIQVGLEPISSYFRRISKW